MIGLSSTLYPYLEALIGRRLIKKGNKVGAQSLIKWKDLDESYTTWELASAMHIRFSSFTLEDKGVVNPGCINTHIRSMLHQKLSRKIQMLAAFLIIVLVKNLISHFKLFSALSAFLISVTSSIKRNL